MILVSRMTAFWPWDPIADGHSKGPQHGDKAAILWMVNILTMHCYGGIHSYIVHALGWGVGMVYPIVYDMLCDKFRSTWADRIQQTNITVPQLANLHQWQPQTMKTHLTLGPQYMHSNPNKNRKVNSYSPTEIVMNCCSIFFPHVLGQFFQGDLNICHDDPTQWFV